MKRIALSITAGLALVIGVIGFAVVWQEYQIDKFRFDGEQFVSEVLADLSTDWDPEILKHYLARSVIQRTEDEELARIAYLKEKLGKPLYLSIPNQTEHRTRLALREPWFTMTYEVECKFENAETMAVVTIVRENSRFQVLRFDIKPRD